MHRIKGTLLLFCHKAGLLATATAKEENLIGGLIFLKKYHKMFANLGLRAKWWESSDGSQDYCFSSNVLWVVHGAPLLLDGRSSIVPTQIPFYLKRFAFSLPNLS